MDAPPVKLYRLPGSHYALRAEMLLQLKRVPYERVNLTYFNHAKALLPISGQDEVPLLLHGRQPVVWRAIPGFLEREYPEPALTPRDTAARELSEAIEAWADLSLGHLVRRVGFHHMRKDRAARARFFGGGARGAATAAVVVPWTVRKYGITPWVVEQDEAVLDEAVERLGALVERNGNLVGKDLSRADVAVAALLSPLFGLKRYQARYGEARLWKWASARHSELKPRRPGSAPPRPS